MKRAALVVSTLSAGTGVAILVLWLAGVVWSGGSGAFCNGLVEWHDTQAAFLKRTDESGSRNSTGLTKTSGLFGDSARLALPESHSADEEETRAVLRDLVRIEEQWLSEIWLYAALNKASSPASAEERISSYRRGEDLRISMNDSLREASARLEHDCGFTSLPIYG